MTGDSLKKRKIAVLGSRSVGKSSLVKQFIENHFVESYYPTIESTFSKSVTYKGVEYDCHIIDTAGQDEYSPLNSQHAIGIHGYVLVYSITSRNSFNMIQIVYDKIVDFCGVSDIPCVVVGSKADLQQRFVIHVLTATLSSSRQVDASEGEKLAQANKAAWIETSAKNAFTDASMSTGKVFELCLAEIEKRTSPTQTEPQTSRCLIM
ncbi:ras-domain-containing protein [Pluteus cervinus]|uniref:Ras-domain-containing protein n=1 Tax=Pluteus cervinus TaxID=181527 RepID=A0ACD3AU57_9AGAR|nr:ras-domain-containing protein [Pluteus cervinus]